MFMKEQHTALFVAPAGVGKTHLALNLLKKEYKHYFDFIIIICPTLKYNELISSITTTQTGAKSGNQIHRIE